MIKHLIKRMIALYTENKAYIRIDVAISGSFQVRKGVKQGCVLLPLLFNVCREWILKKVMENWDGGHNRKEKDRSPPMIICRKVGLDSIVMSIKLVGLPLVLLSEI